MKNLLFIALLLVSSFAFGQVTVTIDNVTPTSQGKVSGDNVTFTVSAPNAKVWGMYIIVDFDGTRNGGGGYDTPTVDNLFSHKTATATKFVGLFKSTMQKERTYRVGIMYEPDVLDPSDPCFVISEPYTVTGK